MENDHSLGPERNLDRLVDAIKSWDLQYGGIGVGCPGPLDFATEGDEVACGIVETAAEALARAVACVTFVVDPNRFVFGGSVALYNPSFIDQVHERAQRYVLNPDKLDFALAECGGDAGLIGAALLV